MRVDIPHVGVSMAVIGFVRQPQSGHYALVVATAGHQVYRRASFTRVLGVFLLIAGAFMFALVAFDARTTHPGVSSHAVAITHVAAIAIGVTFVVLGIAQLRSRLELSAGSVRVVNLMAVHTLQLSDVQSITTDRYRIFARACVLHLQDGSTIGVWALPGLNPGWGTRDEWMDRVVAELRTYLDLGST